MLASSTAVISKAGSAHARLQRRLHAYFVRPRVRLATAAAVGGFIPLTGFSPLNHVPAVLAIGLHPWRVLAMPSVLLAIAALVVQWVLPREARALPRATVAAAWGLLLASGLSLFASGSATDSALVLVVAILAPLITCFALRRSDVSTTVMCAAFLSVTSALLLRDDWVFISQNGAPSGRALFVAKFSNSAYDFHYYGLQNPDMFATFLLIPLALSAFWVLADGLTRTVRALLVGSVALCMFTLVLAYVRFDIGVGLVIVVAAVCAAPVSRRARLAVIVPLAIVAGGFALGSATRAYISDLFHTGSSASGVVRLTSIEDGLRTMLHHPFAGVGLDRYGSAGGTPAHSSIAQAAAETGVLGFLSLVIITGWLVWRGYQALRYRDWSAVAPAAAVAAGIYAISTALTGGAELGLAMDFVPIWALSVVLMVVASDRSTAAAAPAEHQRVDARRLPGRLGAILRPTDQLTGAGIAAATLALAGAGIASANSPSVATVPSRQAVTVVTPAPSWTFGLPPGWVPVVHTRLALASGAIRVTTGGGPQSYQLLGPDAGLDAGTYSLDLTARVVSGGESVAVLDVQRQVFITELGVRPSRGFKTVSVDFRLPRRTGIEVILSDLRTASIRHSTWLIKTIDLVQRSRSS